MLKLHEEVRQLAFNLFGFVPWSGKGQKGVIGVSDIAQAPEVGVIGIKGRDTSEPLVVCLIRVPIIAPFCPPLLGLVVAVLRVTPSKFSLGILRDQALLYKLIQFIQSGSKDGALFHY